MSVNVQNCPKCGKLFVKGFNEVCPNCMKQMEEQYERCRKYLRENRGCTLKELSDATEVSVAQITKFIREGRISIDTAPNMAYPCEVCGSLIRTKNMCDSCRQKLLNDLEGAAKPAEKRADHSSNPLGYRNREEQ